MATENVEQGNITTTSTLTTGADRSIVIHCDGAGCGPNNQGSGIAWIQPMTGQRYVERIDGLTNNQAEYLAFISAVKALADNSIANVFTDSQVMYSQFNNKYRAYNPELVALLSQVRAVIKEKKLTIDLQWVRREKNIAGKLL